jgi:hypothetical protein
MAKKYGKLKKKMKFFKVPGDSNSCKNESITPKRKLEQ